LLCESTKSYVIGLYTTLSGNTLWLPKGESLGPIYAEMPMDQMLFWMS